MGVLENHINGEKQVNASDPVIYTLEQVSIHNKPEDCWLIIRGKVYDVTPWVPHHPGGSLIYVSAGQDCSQLFDSYHPLFVRKMLDRYYIGDVERCKETATLQFDSSGNEEFYLTLKQRVESYFRDRKTNPRVHPHMFIKSVIVVGSYLALYYLTYFGVESYILSLLLAVATGFMAAEIGLSIQHDANHGAYSKWNGLGYFMSASLDFIGASSFMWRQQHVIGHHKFTNIDGYDPDIRVKDPDVRRVTLRQPLQPFHSYQHYYLGMLYGLLALKSVFIDDFTALMNGCIGFIKLPPMTPLERRIFWGGKLFYFSYMLGLPLLFSSHSVSTLATLYVVSQLVTGWVLAFFFQVAHVVEDAAFPTISEGENALLSQGWAALQVRTTTNFSTDSLLWTHLSGGLNFQIEHHLFPSFCHLYYPSIQPIVKATCEEFKLPYKCFSTFWEALGAHFMYLKKVGKHDFPLRLSD